MLPPVKRIRYAPVLKLLLQDRNPEAALANLIQQGGSNHGYHLVNFMMQTRRKIANDPNNVHPNLWRELELILQDPSILPPDRMRLMEMRQTPKKIRQAQLWKGVFQTPGLQQRLKEIQVFDDMYYQFFPTEDMQSEASAHRSTKVSENHQHKSSKRRIFTDQEIDQMIAEASEFCHNDSLDWTKRGPSLKMLECLCLLTGRRKWELCKTLQMRSHPDSDLQAVVWGLAKDPFNASVERPIPLLAPIATIARGINKLRKFQHTMGSYNQGRISRMFPEMSHSLFRDIYTQRAFRDRAINQFHPNPCSELWWRSQALCNTLKQFTEHYASVRIDEPAHDSDDGSTSTELASSASGSPESVQQDPLRCGGQYPNQSDGSAAQRVQA